MIAGGWTLNPALSPTSLPQDVATAFSEAVADLAGAGYSPVLYGASQLVAGKNYLLICKQTLATQEPVEHLVKMIIYKPLSGKAAIMEIKQLV